MPNCLGPPSCLWPVIGQPFPSRPGTFVIFGLSGQHLKCSELPGMQYPTPPVADCSIGYYRGWTKSPSNQFVNRWFIPILGWFIHPNLCRMLAIHSRSILAQARVNEFLALLCLLSRLHRVLYRAYHLNGVVWGLNARLSHRIS